MMIGICAILLVSTAVALFEFSGEKEVVNKWWSTMLLNMSASFTPLMNFVMVVPTRIAMWGSTHAFTAVMIAATFVVYEVVGDDYGWVFEKLEVGYHDFIQLFLNRVVYNMLFIVRLMYEGLVPIWNVVVVVLLDFFYHIWDVIGACDVNTGQWIDMVISIPLAFGELVLQIVKWMGLEGGTSADNLFVNQINITAVVGVVQQRLIYPVSQQADCWCTDLAPVINAVANMLLDSSFGNMINSFVNIPIVLGQAIFRISIPTYGFLDLTPTFAVFKEAAMYAGTWFDVVLDEAFAASFGMVGWDAFRIPQPFFGSAIGRAVAGGVAMAQIPASSISVLLTGNYDMLKESIDFLPPMVQWNAGVRTFAKSSYWVGQMLTDGPLQGEPWPKTSPLLECGYYSYEFYHEKVLDIPDTCHCAKQGCGIKGAGRCMQPSGLCQCNENYTHVIPPMPGRTYNSYPCVRKCTTDESCASALDDIPGNVCMPDGRCMCNETATYNLDDGLCYAGKEFVTNAGPDAGPPQTSWTDCTAYDEKVPNVDNPFACAVQHGMLAPLGAFYTAMNFGKNLFFGAISSMESRHGDWSSHISFLWENMQDSDGMWYPRSDSISCEYRKEYKDDCTTYRPNCQCNLDVTDILLENYDPYCKHPTLNADVYSHMDGFAFYTGIGALPGNFAASIGVAISAGARLVTENLRVVSRTLSGALPWLLSFPARKKNGDTPSNCTGLCAEGNLARYPVNCYWGTPFDGPVPPYIGTQAFFNGSYVGEEGIVGLITTWNEKVSPYLANCKTNDTYISESSCSKLSKYLAWASLQQRKPSQSVDIDVRDTINYINMAHTAIESAKLMAECRNHHYCAARVYTNDIKQCDTDNNNTCMCNPNLPDDTDCRCIAYFPRTADSNAVQGTHSISYHNHLLATLFTPNSSHPWCNSLSLEWHFYRQSELFVALENIVDDFNAGEPYSSSNIDSCMSNPVDSYQIVRKSSLDSLFMQTPEGYTMRTIEGGGTQYATASEQKQFWRPCDVSHECSDLHCWCPLWVHNDLACNIGLFFRQAGWASITWQRQIAESVIGVISSEPEMVNTDMTQRLCHISQSYAAGAAAIAGLFKFIPTCSVATERRIASVLFTIIDVTVLYAMESANVYYIGLNKLIENPSEWETVVVYTISSGFMLFGTQSCQLLLGLDRAIHGIKRDGSIVGTGTGTTTPNGVVGPMLKAGDIYTKFVGKELVDFVQLGLQLAVSFVAIFTSKSTRDLRSHFEDFAKTLLEILKTVTKLFLMEYAKIFEIILTLLPPPVNKVFKWILTTGCFIVQGAGYGIVEVIDGAASILGSHLDNPFNPKECMQAPAGGIDPYPESSGDDDQTGTSAGTRRLYEKFDAGGLGTYALVRENLDWNGTTFCAELGREPEPPKTQEGKLLWKDCASNRFAVHGIRKMLNNDEIPATFFDDWMQPMFFAFQTARAMLGIFSQSGADIRHLQAKNYPVETARALTTGMESLVLNLMGTFDANNLRQNWIPSTFPDYKEDVNSTGARLDRILKTWQDMPSVVVTGDEWHHLFHAADYHMGVMWSEISPPRATAPPIHVVTKARRRLTENLQLNKPIQTSGGVALAENKYQKIGQVPCKTDDEIGICLNCRLLTTFLDSSIEMIKRTGSFYSSTFIKSAKAFEVSTRSHQEGNAPSVPSSSGSSTNKKDYDVSNRDPQPHLPGTTGNCEAIINNGTVCKSQPTGSNYAHPPNSTFKSPAHGIDVSLSNSTAAGDILKMFFTGRHCNVSIPVVRKPLLCWVEDVFQPCEYPSVAYDSCDKPAHTLGESFGMVGYVLVGHVVWSQLTGMSVPFVFMIWVYFFAFVSMRYGYVLRCAPIMPGCLIRDIQMTIRDLSPECFCQIFREHLVVNDTQDCFLGECVNSSALCTPGICDVENPTPFKYTGCPSTDLGYSWAFFFYLRWHFPHVFSFVVTSEWSPFYIVGQNSGALKAMLIDIQQAQSVNAAEIECFWAQSPNAIGLLLLIPLVVSSIVMLSLRFIALLQWMLFSLMLSGSFVLDAIPVIDRQRTQSKK